MKTPGEEGASCFVITREGSGLVLCSYDPAAGMGTIDRIWVEPPCRGKGVGSALLAAAERELTRRGARTARLVPDAIDAADAQPEYFRRLEEWYIRRGYRNVESRGFWSVLSKTLS
ncbi:MAG: GNAT family N-acetyltransferase [Stellaceae bacterium]